MNLNKKDYQAILEKYGEKVIYSKHPKTKRKIFNKQKTRALTRKILSEKLCKCIKKVQKNSTFKLQEPAAIAICNKSIFSNRGIKLYKFTCKKKPRLLPKKGTKKYLSKTMKRLKTK